MKNYQNKLFPYAYNIIGSSEDAKDAVQDILVKYLSIDKEHIENEFGYLIKSVINQSINLRKKRDKFTTNNVYLPEPFSTENADENINKEEILSYSMLVLLEKLTAKERAVFILKEAFDYSHKEIAETIGFTIENSRKLLSRAKAKMANHKTGNLNNHAQNIEPIEHYIHAIKNGDITALEKLLSEDILLAADGGKNIKVVRELTTGITNTSKLLLYVYRAFLTGLKFRISSVNHQPAILYYQNELLYNCQVFELEGMKIKSIYSIVDPNKLKSLFL
ncbi:RNA polymerase subunit sigma-24 [Flagellimonas aquimarina]|uniref:RNA polymerase subunit sigma-24 n=1 Tax=Flagellimonas aquimarina TaxID=2201895 RepID=A0A316L379_9FLAO|nr:sigma-70 family RNA polymerase sigma factor [Allomuricauda koreensis]PWL40286.1 RNA polymerase subunit sigma-24 [Allomuricauda koreensis]